MDRTVKLEEPIDGATFRRVLGPDCQVVRTDHILAGARRCAYRITPR